MSPEADASRRERIGVFGGTFDPPHVGHVAVAVDVADHLGLDRVIWMPAGVPPHKDASAVTDPRIRLEMVRLAAAADPRFEVSEIELQRPGPSFTVDTLRSLRERNPDADLYLVVGADQLEDFATGWRDPVGILELARLAIMDRDGDDARAVAPALPGIERSVHVPVRRIDLSSTAVRDAVRAGRAIQELLPPGVAAVVRRERLYRGGDHDRAS